ncbi:MAG: M14 family metallopeptidase [Flavobacteriaceae bacterium]|nr:M14 family metallopeptidase [Flavobacteriaceae bacterium]
MKNVAFLITLLSSLTIFSQTKSPKEFLGYELGERFSRHHQVVDYFKHVEETNNNVSLLKYGQTYENRPLYLAFITAPENFSKLEELRQNHLRNAGVVEAMPTNDIPVVWLSYNVHGNEASSIEASMKTLFALVDSNNQRTKEWLKNTIIIIDPCINPDGRDRYANWYNQYGNSPYNKNPDSKEHHEPWLSGRPNHYMFDLNRDWAWATQVESQQRLKQYNRWLPHIHVDFHEQGVDNPYYFAPAAEPYHEVITQFQRDFQTTIGKNHAKYFDKNGWLYFTKEWFDLLYPSYGDTYPTFNGAIGMTYEQAGHGRAGLGITNSEGNELTLKDRIEHHYTTGLSTIEVASKNADVLTKEFAEYFRKAKTNPKGDYKSFVISASNDRDKMNSLRKLLDRHEISYGISNSTSSVKGFDYQLNKKQTIKLTENDLVVTMNQPKSNLIKSLFEPQAKLKDSLTYDITAWSLPYARGLKAYALSNTIAVKEAPQVDDIGKISGPAKPYAYLSKWNSVEDASFLAALVKHKIKARFSTQAFSIEGKNYQPGSLIITRTGNEKLGDTFDQLVRKIAKEHGRKLNAVTSGMVSKGKDFGSSTVRYVKPPKVAVLSGKGISTLSFGEIWHFFEQQLKYPVAVIDTDYFGRVNLNKYSVLILPNGWYGSTLNEKGLKSLKEWVQNGGRIIAIDRALNKFAESKEFKLSKFKDDDEKKAVEKAAKERKEKLELEAFDNLERQSISNLITGSIFKATMDATNPLGFGYGKSYHTLRLNNSHYAYLKDGQNVSVIKDKKDQVSGFAGANALKNVDKSLVFGVEAIGKGEIVYLADNPLFRSFWENGKLAFCNAVFLVGQ